MLITVHYIYFEILSIRNTSYHHYRLCPSLCYYSGLTENALRENDGPSKLQGMKMQDMKLEDRKLTDQFAGHEIAGHENDGPNCRT